MRLEDFYDHPTIASAFPLVFASGARWNEMTAKCGGCGRIIDDANLRGTVARWGPKHAPTVFVVDGLGYCFACERLTPFRHRLHADMSVSWEREGVWVRWEPPRPSLGSRIRRQLRRWFRLATESRE